MATRYTIIKSETGGALDDNVWRAIVGNADLRPLVDPKKDVQRNHHDEIKSIDVPTDALKKAIKDKDIELCRSLRAANTTLSDVAVPSFIVSGVLRAKTKVGLPIPANGYIKATLKDQSTLVFPHQTRPKDMVEVAQRIKSYVPAVLGISALLGGGYVVKKTIDAGVSVVQPHADENQKLLNGGDEGLDDVVRRHAGLLPKPKNHEQQQAQRDANPQPSGHGR